VRLWGLVQARYGSTRFPGKIAMRLGDRTVLQHVLKRARQIPHVLAVRPIFPHDAPDRDEADVLGRYADVARTVGAEAVMRITGDCPLLDPQASALVVERFLAEAVDYCSNVWPKRTWPDGLDTEVFSTDLLLRADREATDPDDRQHVTGWMRRHAVRIASIELPVDWSWVRLTCDTPEDLRWLRTAITAPRSGAPVPFTSAPAPRRRAPSGSVGGPTLRPSSPEPGRPSGTWTATSTSTGSAHWVRSG